MSLAMVREWLLQEEEVHCCMGKVKRALSCAGQAEILPDSATCSLLAHFEMTPGIGLWVSCSFGSQFLVEIAWRDHEVLYSSPKVRSLSIVLSIRKRSLEDYPISQWTHSMNSILHQHPHAAGRSCAWVLERMVRLSGGMSPCLTASSLCTLRYQLVVQVYKRSSRRSPGVLWEAPA